MSNIESTPDRILIINAHPDDSILEAGFTARAARRGARVDEAILTHTSDLRVEEEMAAADILGIRGLHLVGDEMGWEDGTLHRQTPGLLVASLVGVMDRATDEGHPITDIVTTHGSVTGHPDHMAVSRAARAAYNRHPHALRYWGNVFTQEEHSIFVNQYGPDGYFVQVPKPPKPRPGKYQRLRLSPEEYEIKRKAAWAHNSQIYDVERHDERFQQLADNGGVVELYRYKSKS